MRHYLVALLLTTALPVAAIAAEATPRQPLQIAQSADGGQAAFVAAGSNLEKLKAVAAENPDSVWGKLAAARVKVLEAQAGGSTRQIQVVPKAEEPVMPTPEPAPAPEPAPPVQEAVEPAPAPVEQQAAPAPAQPAPDVPTLRVASDGSGQYTSIVDAIAAAASGSRIEVYPGTYTGGVIIDKPLDIVGVGSFEQIIWQVEGTDLIQWKAASGLISNLTLLQKDGCEKTCNTIYFNSGSATVENSALTSAGGATIYVQGANARPRIYKNNVHNSGETGIYFELFAGGEVESNDIAFSGFAGIEIKSGAHPVIRANNVRDGKQGGIFANTNARGIIMDNDVFNNAFAGVEIKDGADPVVRSNRIYNQQQNGVFVNSKARGSIVSNFIYGNGRSNVAVSEGANPSIISNDIYESKEGGMLFESGALGLVESNQIYKNALSNIEVNGEANPTFRKNIVREGKQSGIFIHSKGRGTFEDNDINANGFSGVEVTTRGDAVFTNNRITGNTEYAIRVYDQGRGTYTDNDLGNNKRGSSSIEKTAGKVKRSGNRE